MFTPDRIAPCGLDCYLCEIAHLPEHPCPGCRSHGVDKPDFCADLCEIAHCESIAALSTPYCDSCNRYPCEPILALEQRYAAMYPLRESPMGNLKAIRERGVAAFLDGQRRKWSCPIAAASSACTRESASNAIVASRPKTDSGGILMNDIIDRAQAYVRDVFANDFSGHDCFHTMRVFRLATAIAAAEGADPTIVQLAALLHDVDDRKLSPETCETRARAVAFMRACQLPEDAIDRVCEIISEVSFAGTDSVAPATLEGKCVQDADRLDAIGAIGIARTFAYGGHAHRPIHDPDVPPVLHMNRDQYARSRSSSINHFYEKLLLLRDMMNTPTARRMADQRHLYMQGFLDEFLAEWDGRR